MNAPVCMNARVRASRLLRVQVVDLFFQFATVLPPELIGRSHINISSLASGSGLAKTARALLKRLGPCSCSSGLPPCRIQGA